MEMGWEGYGLFWALIEMLRNESDHKMRTHYKSIAFALHTQEDSIKKLINDFDLFAIDHLSRCIFLVPPWLFSAAQEFHSSTVLCLRTAAL